MVNETKKPFIHIGRLYVSIQRMTAEPYRTYFRNSEGACWIFRGFGILFVAVFKAGVPIVTGEQGGLF